MIACPYCQQRHPTRELVPWGRGPVAIAECPLPSNRVVYVPPLPDAATEELAHFADLRNLGGAA